MPRKGFRRVRPIVVAVAIGLGQEVCAGSARKPLRSAASPRNPAREATDTFKVDDLPIARGGEKPAQVRQMPDRVGYRQATARAGGDLTCRP
jgi:hypothetical protein